MSVEVSNVLESEKLFFWFPPKTASTHAATLLGLFDLKQIHVEEGKPPIYKDFHHNHLLGFPPNHLEYKFVCTARNPFTRVVSMFKFRNKDNPTEITTTNFRKFFLKIIENKSIYSYFNFENKENRRPDFFIRVEYMFKDYSQFNFIRQSKLYTSGFIYDFCQKKINTSSSNSKLDKEFFTKDMIDQLNHIAKDYMKLLGYEYPY